jgi:hypothetical protein
MDIDYIMWSHIRTTIQIILDFLNCGPVLFGVEACLLMKYDSGLLVSSTAGSVLSPRQLLHFVLWRDSRVLTAGVTTKLLTPRKHRRTVFAPKTVCFICSRRAGHLVVVKPLKAIWATSSSLLNFPRRVFGLRDWRTHRSWGSTLKGHLTVWFRS